MAMVMLKAAHNPRPVNVRVLSSMRLGVWAACQRDGHSQGPACV